MATRAPDISATAMRQFLLQAAELETWTPDYLGRVLGVDAAGARQALAALHAAGYVEPVGGRHIQWRNTPAGNAAAGVSRARPILRKTVQKAVDALLDRVKQVNGDPHYLYRVEKVVLFGPFLTTDSDPVKNADLAVQLAPKETDAARHEAAASKRAERAAAAGKRFVSFHAKSRYAEDEVRAFLKGRSRALALYPLEDWVIQRPHKVLFEPSGA